MSLFTAIQAAAKAGGPAVPFNVALGSNGSTATSSSGTVAGTLPGTIDGTRHTNGAYPSSAWASSVNPNVTPVSVEVAFGATRTITEIDFYTLADAVHYNTDPLITDTGATFRPADFTVDYWDGGAWVNIATVVGNANIWRQFIFAAISTTKIRIRCTAVPGGAGSLYVVEIEAWGT